jgi:hypothetical protein
MSDFNSSFVSYNRLTITLYVVERIVGIEYKTALKVIKNTYLKLGINTSDSIFHCR